MKKQFLILILSLVGLSCSVPYECDDNLNQSMKSIRDLILLDKKVAISKVIRFDVNVYKELAEDDEFVEGLTAAEKLELSENPPGDFYCFFSFISDLHLHDFMARCATLYSNKIEVISIGESCEESGIVPTFPDKALKNTDGVMQSWYRGDKIFTLYLTAFPVVGANGTSYIYYGFCRIEDMATNGAPPRLGFDKQGKLIKPSGP